MADVRVEFKDNVGSSASFVGAVAPNGATGYTFSGTLRATSKLDRSYEDFENTVRLGHGGTSGDYSYLEFPVAGSGENVVAVEGAGTRAANDTVDFRLGANTTAMGGFRDGDKVIATVGGPAQELRATYINKDGLGNTKYDVRFNGTARSDGPTGYVIEGELEGYGGPGALTTQYATFGYRPVGGSWQYETVACDAGPKRITIRGRRGSGAAVQATVGATSGIANTYQYGSQVDCALPADF